MDFHARLGILSSKKRKIHESQCCKSWVIKVSIIPLYESVPPPKGLVSNLTVLLPATIYHTIVVESSDLNVDRIDYA